MNINATLVGQLFIVVAMIMGVVFFYLGKRKTKHPILTALAGFVSTFVPIVVIIYLIVLINKPDLPIEE